MSSRTYCFYGTDNNKLIAFIKNKEKSKPIRNIFYSTKSVGRLDYI